LFLWETAAGYLLHLGAQEETFSTVHKFRSSMTEAERERLSFNPKIKFLKKSSNMLQTLHNHAPFLLQEKRLGVEVDWRTKFR